MAESANTAPRTVVVFEETDIHDFNRVNYVRVSERSDGQRLDNFLLRILKGVPKSHVYRIVRNGEVRINKKRAECQSKIALGDEIRIPPVRTAIIETVQTPIVKPLTDKDLPVLREDRDLIIVNKPSGLACHGGSGVAYGLIERLRASRPDCSFLELAHRLDRDTSGVLIVCKTRKALVRLHEMQREGAIQKRYRLLVQGDWVNQREHVRLPLSKYTLPSGERRVRVDDQNGLKAHTIFTLIKRYGDVSYLEAELKTGRTHQIRVHAASTGHPLVGDAKYGDYEFNEAVKKGLLGTPFARMFLHAERLNFMHPVTKEPVSVIAPLEDSLKDLVSTLDQRA